MTRQFTQYGQVYREFDAYYDWMHHGESSIYFYYFGLADPTREPDRSRAQRFASFYMDEDLSLSHPGLPHAPSNPRTAAVIASGSTLCERRARCRTASRR